MPFPLRSKRPLSKDLMLTSWSMDLARSAPTEACSFGTWAPQASVARSLGACYSTISLSWRTGEIVV